MTTTGCDTWRSLEEVVGADFTIVKNGTLRAEYRGLVYSAPDFGLRTLNTSTVKHTAQSSAGMCFDFDKNVWRAGLVQVPPGRKLRRLPHDRRSAGLAASLLNDILGTMVLVLVVGAISTTIAATGPVPGFGAYLVAAIV